MTINTERTSPSKAWTITLWIAQVLLAILYFMAGAMKITQPMDTLAVSGMGFVTSTPEFLVRLIGVLEVLGVAGLLLPAATRILPMLTPAAALGLSLVQIGAIIVHAFRGETLTTLPVNLIFLALSVYVLWGRTTKAPIDAR
jgi:uncharacterized membrane protein YphA (DoxX/SURF4 family)